MHLISTYLPWWNFLQIPDGLSFPGATWTRSVSKIVASAGKIEQDITDFKCAFCYRIQVFLFFRICIVSVYSLSARKNEASQWKHSSIVTSYLIQGEFTPCNFFISLLDYCTLPVSGSSFPALILISLTLEVNWTSIENSTLF